MEADHLDELERMISDLTVDQALQRLLEDADAGRDRLDELLAVAGRRAQSEVAVARQALDIGDRLAARMDRLDVVPASLYLRARLTLNSGQPDDALRLIDQSRSGWLALDRPLDAYRTELGRMHVLDDLGRHGEAAAVSKALLEDLDRLDPALLSDDDRTQVDWLQAAANENLGVASGFTGQHDVALEAYRMAEERYREVGSTDDLARCRANRGVELVAIGRASEGLEVLQSAAEMFAEVDDQLSYGQCLGHVADAELLLGLYAAALTRYEEARQIIDQLEARTEGCRIRLRTVRAYLALNLIDEAEALATEAEHSLEEMALTHDLAEARWLCGVAQLRAGRPEDALGRMAAAAEGAALSEDPPLLVRVHLTSSEGLFEIGDHAGAIDAAERALTEVTAGNWPTEELFVRLRLAQLLDDQAVVDGHLQEAERLADVLGLPHLRYPVLLELGRHRRRHGGVREAKRWLQEAVDVVEGLRGLIPDEALRTSYLEGRTAAHVDLMSMLIEDGNPEDLVAAFDLAEASKARTLNDILAGVIQPGLADQRADPDITVGTPIDRYEADLYAAYSALSSGDPSMTRSRRRAVQDRAVELERAIRLAHLRSEAGPSTNGLDPADSRPTLRPPPGRQLVEYHVMGEEIAIFVWSGGMLSVSRCALPTGEVAELVARWDRDRRRFQLANHVGTNTVDPLLANATDGLRKLWVAVFAPALDLLDGGNPDLLIVPHGPLHAVPFHALVGPDGPVGQTWTTTVAPSYAVAARIESANLPELTGPADESETGSASDGASDQASDRAGARSLVLGVPDEAAPEVAAEATAVADLLSDATLLMGADATADALVAGAERPLRVLHLACHGFHRARNPMFSSLKLGDRWFTARDVLGLRLSGTLVVLSACETGRQGDIGPGDEAIGLARSFLAAGAVAVVVSLWMTSDRVTAELMEHFYTELQSGRSPSEALRSAQTTVATHHPHPADWAPFVVHGGFQGES